MYICNNCESVFETPDVHKEHHPYGMTSATEYWSVCPHCGETDFDEAKKCERCGEYVAELDEGLCDCCYGDVYGI
jgi:hypothetical protein